MKLKLKENNIQKVLFGNVFSKKIQPNVLFYDYDGTLLYSYTKVEFLSLGGLPNLPDRSSENLTCDGWNWTLLEITDCLNTSDADVNVGAIYHTTDNKTHITCRPNESFPSVSITLKPSAANTVSVDWGDGSASEKWTSASSATTKTHTYTGVTDSSVYDITISCTSGTYMFNNYITGSLENNINVVYTDIKLSNKVTILALLQCCYSLKSITIPNSVTGFGNNCFQHCYNLQSVNIPRSITSLGVNQCFYQCQSLQSITIPGCIRSLGGSCFNGCNSLQSVTIPNSVTSLGEYCFSNCISLKSINIPNGVTSLGNYCFSGCHSLQSINIPSSITSLSTRCFYSCFSLQSITIPSSVTSICTYCFYGCSSLKKVYVERTTPPTLSNNVALPDNSNLVIYIPTGTLSTYQSSGNWSATKFASKMREYDY